VTLTISSANMTCCACVVCFCFIFSCRVECDVIVVSSVVDIFSSIMIEFLCGVGAHRMGLCACMD